MITDGTLESLKYLGVVLMTVDHIYKYLFNATYPAAFAVGRLAMPIFALVLAYNLARPGNLERGVYRRTAIRLFVFGLFATPAFVALGGLAGGIYPLNIMFTLLMATVVMNLIDRGKGLAALFVFGLGGALVEFWWPAIGLCVAIWLYVRSPRWPRMVLGLMCLASLQAINGNAWALAVLPIVFLIQGKKLTLKRCRWLFYAYYPLHLTALWLMRIPMAKAGYLFF